MNPPLIEVIMISGITGVTIVVILFGIGAIHRHILKKYYNKKS